MGMYSRLRVGEEYILDTIMRKLGDPVPITTQDHVVIVDREDGLYYILEVSKDAVISYPVFYKVLRAGRWEKAIQKLILFNSNM